MFLSFLIVSTSYAGSPSCSDVTQITASGNYAASNSECIISVEKTFSEYTVVHLPPGASIGDKFTVQDNTSYTLDYCADYGDPGEPLIVCNPAGVIIDAVDATVDGSQSITLSGYYYQEMPLRQRVIFIFDGSDWNATYSDF